MPRIFYVHWNKEEALEAVRELRQDGHTVVHHFSTEEGAGSQAWKSIKASPPDALVISLDRLPSHGRRVAAVTTENKKLRDIPIVFVGGTPDKIERAKQDFPKARFVSRGRLKSVLNSL